MNIQAGLKIRYIQIFPVQVDLSWTACAVQKAGVGASCPVTFSPAFPFTNWPSAREFAFV
jgi:hypothetical protein